MNFDSFGEPVDVGDYVYFRVKTKYGYDALSIGRVVKVSAKGSMSLRAINTHGKTIEKFLADEADRQVAARARSDYKPAYESWIAEMGKPYDQRLASASSTVKVHVLALSPAMQQVLA